MVLVLSPSVKGLEVRRRFPGKEPPSVIWSDLESDQVTRRLKRVTPCHSLRWLVVRAGDLQREGRFG